jgi:hypothetical protein
MGIAARDGKEMSGLPIYAKEMTTPCGAWSFVKGGVRPRFFIYDEYFTVQP